MRRPFSLGPGVLFALLVLVAPAWAQEPEARFRIVPRVGAVLPLNDMQQTARDTVMVLKVRPQAAVGLSIEYVRPKERVDYRASVSYAHDMTMAGRGVVEWESCGDPCIEPIIGGPRDPVGTTSLLALHADLVIALRDPESRHRLSPHFIIGAGMKRFGIDDTSLDPAVAGRLNPDDASVLAYVGAALNLRLTRTIDLVAEVGDYFSLYETSSFVLHPETNWPVVIDNGSWTHNDLFVSIGLRVPWHR